MHDTSGEPKGSQTAFKPLSNTRMMKIKVVFMVVYCQSVLSLLFWQLLESIRDLIRKGVGIFLGKEVESRSEDPSLVLAQ